MTNNDKWLQRVADKLNELHLNGCEFDNYRWRFDWDDKLSVEDNLQNVRAEDRALTTLTQAKVIKSDYRDNYYRNQQEESLAIRGVGMWGDWETTDPAHREYDYLTYLDGFDHDRFLWFCETHGFNPNGKGAKLPNNLKLDDKGAASASEQPTTKAEVGNLAQLFLIQKTLKLTYHGTTLTIKHFDSIRRFNYGLVKKLLGRPDEMLGKDELGAHLKAIRSNVKDWPKLMGFTGEMKDIFFSVDTKNQKIMLHPHKSLTDDEAAILHKLVNTKKTK